MHAMMVKDRRVKPSRPHEGDEIHYYDYDRHYEKGLSWYTSHIYQYDGVVGDKSPTYLHCHKAAGRMARDVPNIKLFVMLRNPVDRAYSHYYKARQKETGYETLPTFEDALDAEPYRLAECDQEDFENSARHLHAYVERGQYVDHLAHWLEHFDRRQFAIIQSKELFDEPENTVRKAWAWMGLQQPHAVYNIGTRHQKTKDKPPMERKTRERLETHFAPYNRDLQDLLGRKFDGWVT